MADAKLTSKGQVTIPKEIRERLGVEQGDRLEFRVEAGGRIVVSAAPPAKPLPAAGHLAKFAKREPVTVEEMNQAVARATVRRAARSGRR